MPKNSAVIVIICSTPFTRSTTFTGADTSPTGMSLGVVLSETQHHPTLIFASSQRLSAIVFPQSHSLPLDSFPFLIPKAKCRNPDQRSSQHHPHSHPALLIRNLPPEILFFVAFRILEPHNHHPHNWVSTTHSTPQPPPIPLQLADPPQILLPSPFLPRRSHRRKPTPD